MKTRLSNTSKWRALFPDSLGRNHFKRSCRIGVVSVRAWCSSVVFEVFEREAREFQRPHIFMFSRECQFQRPHIFMWFTRMSISATPHFHVFHENVNFKRPHIFMCFTRLSLSLSTTPHFHVFTRMSISTTHIFMCYTRMSIGSLTPLSLSLSNSSLSHKKAIDSTQFNTTGTLLKLERDAHKVDLSSTIESLSVPSVLSSSGKRENIALQSNFNHVSLSLYQLHTHTHTQWNSLKYAVKNTRKSTLE